MTNIISKVADDANYPPCGSSAMSTCMRCRELVLLIFTSADTASVIYFGQTCIAARAAINGFLRATFNVDRYLGSTMRDTSAFRLMQARTGTVITGAAALLFFARKHSPSDVISLYVNPGHGYEVARHLIDVQGFKYQPLGSKISQEFTDSSSTSDPEKLAVKQRMESVYSFKTVDEVHRFVRYVDKGSEIELFVAMTARSTIHAILCSHSSKLCYHKDNNFTNLQLTTTAASMNFISYDIAVSLYPRATFIKKENHALFWNILNKGNDSGNDITRFDDLGYGRASWRSKAEAKEVLHTGRMRRVGDGCSWMINLGNMDFSHVGKLTPTSPDVKRNLVLENSWRLVGTGGSVSMKYCVVSLPIFRYSYTVGNDEEAAEMRTFYEDQWFYETRAKKLSPIHQTWYANIILTA